MGSFLSRSSSSSSPRTSPEPSDLADQHPHVHGSRPGGVPSLSNDNQSKVQKNDKPKENGGSQNCNDLPQQFCTTPDLRMEWGSGGIPNTSEKYKEHQLVKWHETPFGKMLDRALLNEKHCKQRFPAVLFM